MGQDRRRGMPSDNLTLTQYKANDCMGLETSYIRPTQQ